MSLPDEDLIERLDSYDERIDRLTYGTYLALGAMVFVFLLAATSFTVLQVRKVDHADQAQSDAKQAKALGVAIQQQRREATRNSCQDTNDRNVNTIAQLKKLTAVAKKGASPARARRIEHGSEQFEFLVNALVPHQDCEARVEQVVPPEKRKP